MNGKTIVERRRAVDLLLALFRLNNHEKMAQHDGPCSEELSRWVLKSRISLSPELFSWNERLFSWESFFGLRFFPYLFSQEIREPEDLIASVEGISAGRLLRRFFSRDFVETDEVEALRVKMMEEDESEALKYVFGNLEVSNSERYSAMVLLSDQEGAKRAYIELLHSSSKGLAEVESQHFSQEYCDWLLIDFRENYESFGLPFIRELLDLDPETAFGQLDFRVCLSWFLGGSNINVTIHEMNTVISLLGCDRLSKRALLPNKLDPLEIMACLSHIEEVYLLKRLFKRDLRLDDLVAENGRIHRHELYERLARLSRSELVQVSSNGTELLFSSSLHLVERALDRVKAFLQN